MPFTEKFSITTNLIPKPSKRRSGLMINKVRFLVAHDTGNKNSTAAQNVKYYINSRNDMSASAHIFVDDKEIIECVPALTAAPEKAWHVLYTVSKDNELYGVNANDAAIGVEYCFGDNIDADKAYQKYVWVLARLCFKYGLDASKDITGHFFLDPKRKTDPVTGLAQSRRTYDRLLKDIAREYDECTGLSSPIPVLNTTSKQGSVTASVRLNIRNNPDTKSDIIQTVNSRTILVYKAVIQNGQPVNNNPVWYQDANSNYFWSGGVTENEVNAGNVDADISTPANTPNDNEPVAALAATDLKPDKACVDFLKKWEGLKLTSYTDSAGIWTIGYGTIMYEDGRHVKKGETITQQRAEDLLAFEVGLKAKGVNAAIDPVALTQSQYNALVSFAYNTGSGALRGSTLLKRVKVNPQDALIRDAFIMWNKARVDGQLVFIKGLDNRRREEADLYFS